MVSLIIAEGMFQFKHRLGGRDEENSGRNRWFFKGSFNRRDILIYLYLEFGPLNKTAFECLEELLPWVQTCIRLNNIEPLTPDGWFKECHGIQ